MPYYFIRSAFPSGDRVLGPFEPFEMLQRVQRLRDQSVEYAITDEDGKVVNEEALARGDILSPRDEELAKMMETEFSNLWKAALADTQGRRNLALNTMVRLVRRHIEVAAHERERRLTG